jgi:hypothetical protein
MEWYKMFDSFMVSQILQQVSITIVFTLAVWKMVHSFSYYYMLMTFLLQAYVCLILAG